MTTLLPSSLDLASLRLAYQNGLKPSELIHALADRLQHDTHHVWISHFSHEQLLARAKELDGLPCDSLPLYGVPFAVKDNIDVQGLPTTAGCPDYAYSPQQHAFVVQALVDAGAIVIGKTNLDQFATGLNGTRSPYGACRNAFDPDYISGGSSSGSAVAVARGLVSFALGTDTAGSGRVPAAFNNLIGLKASCGRLSTRGVVPACRSLDCVSIFALTANDAETLLAVAGQFDPLDPFAKPARPHGHDFGRSPTLTVGVPRPEQREFFGDSEAQRLFEQGLLQLVQQGATLVEIDLAPFTDAARLLYEGPWVAERYLAIRDFIEAQPEAVFPVTREITLQGKHYSAADSFAQQYRLLALKRRCDEVWQQIDCLVTPTAPTHYRIDDMQANPIQLNSRLGYYTNFMNLLDYAAVAVPTGFRVNGLPVGVTLCAPAQQDTPLLHLAQRLQQANPLPLGATGKPFTPSNTSLAAQSEGVLRLAVCGAHLSGQPLNPQLVTRGGRLVSLTRTAGCYKLYALAGGPPARPGMVRNDTQGESIEVEVWELPLEGFATFVQAIPSPLGIGKVQLEDGTLVSGFICEDWATTTATDITHYQGWRAYLADQHR